MSSCYMNSEGVRKRERKDGGSVFVTVGSTSFDDLVRAVTEEGFRKASPAPLYTKYCSNCVHCVCSGSSVSGV